LFPVFGFPNSFVPCAGGDEGQRKKAILAVTAVEFAIDPAPVLRLTMAKLAAL
jgi:hypothetical protein